MDPGVRRFIDDMTEVGFDPKVEAELVIYQVEAIDGFHAGGLVETGVGVGDLVPWPQFPPHWVHFPASISFSRTNSQPSPKSGWLMHSREITGWGAAAPSVSWTSHLRAVLSEAAG